MGKLENITKITGFFQSLGIPFPTLNAYLAGSTECFGGLCLLLGLGSRLITIPLIFTMIVAYATAEREALFSIFTDPDKFTGADPFLFMMTAIIVFLFGPGFISVDRLLKKIFSTKPDPSLALKSAITIAVAYIVGGLIPLLPYVLISRPSEALLISASVTLWAAEASRRKRSVG